jgi:hypothetical protein
MLNPLAGVIATAGETAIERRPKSNDFAGFLTIILSTGASPLFFMVRKITETNERKQPVSISLTAVEIVMLNNLSKSMNMNRSRCLAGLIRDHSFKEMGLVSLEVHLQRNQTWRPRLSGRINHGNPGACNPHAPGGYCQHSRCKQLYAQWGV